MPSPRTIKQRRSPKDGVDELLFDILSHIAVILVSTGCGYSRMNELTKKAFVRAAHLVGEKSGTRLSIARIAALTGLTRTDVSKIVRIRGGELPDVGRPTNRIARVARGWATDKKFQEDHRPRDLAFAGAGNTFSKLVRQYSGDIPPKAMLTEMCRLGMVQKRPGGLLILVRSDVQQSQRTTNALKAAIPWISFLAHASAAPQSSELTSRSDKFELRFSSLPQVFAAMRELHGRHRAFVTSLAQLGNRKDSQGRYALNVSVAVAATNPHISKLRRQSKPKQSRGTSE
jgi:hypothetical protein